MLHPVGRLPARVYWRRRLVALAVLLGLVGGAAWLGVQLLRPSGPTTTQAAASSTTQVPTPALERVLPSLAAVRTPETSPDVPEATRPAPAAETPAPTTAATPAGPAPGGPCADDMVELRLEAPTTARAGAEVLVEIVVRNVSTVPCERRLDAALQEVRLATEDGTRVWGSNDCLREGGARSAVLQPGEEVVLPVEWSGRTSEPTCTRERDVPPAGVYLLRGSLDTAETPVRRIRLG